jgi:hypothetical protein
MPTVAELPPASGPVIEEPGDLSQNTLSCYWRNGQVYDYIVRHHGLDGQIADIITLGNNRQVYIEWAPHRKAGYSIADYRDDWCIGDGKHEEWMCRADKACSELGQ